MNGGDDKDSASRVDSDAADGDANAIERASVKAFVYATVRRVRPKNANAAVTRVILDAARAAAEMAARDRTGAIDADAATESLYAAAHIIAGTTPLPASVTHVPVPQFVCPECGHKYLGAGELRDGQCVQSCCLGRPVSLANLNDNAHEVLRLLLKSARVLRDRHASDRHDFADDIEWRLAQLGLVL